MARTPKLTHLAKGGEARMVDVSAKAATERVAVAEGRVVMAMSTLDLVRKGNAKKGDVLGAARIAGIMAAKKTHELIPLCHPLAISQIAVDIELDQRLPGLIVRASVKVSGPENAAIVAARTSSGDVRSGFQSSLCCKSGRTSSMAASAAYDVTRASR